MSVLSQAASECPPTAKWRPYLVLVATRLAEAKPAMASLRNATDRLLKLLVELSPVERGRRAITLSDEMLAELSASGRSEAATAASILQPDASAATCSYSSAVLGACSIVREVGNELRVTVFESLAGDDALGRRMAHELSSLDLPARAVYGPVTVGAVGDLRLALVGADAVTAQYIINGTPSLELAQAAKGHVPFHVVCETVKLVRKSRSSAAMIVCRWPWSPVSSPRRVSLGPLRWKGTFPKAASLSM